MAQENADGQEKTEAPTEERRDLFRKRGEVAHSREITSVLVLCGSLAFLSLYAQQGIDELRQMMAHQFEQSTHLQFNPANVTSYFRMMGYLCLRLTVPLFVVTATLATFSTLAQTRMNMSWDRVKPNFNKLNPLAGLQRLVSTQALLELVKSLGKMVIVGLIGYLILFSEWQRLPGLLNLSLAPTWLYWAKITRNLFWSVAILLLLMAAGDYFYNYMTLEKKMRMSKQEIKEDYKQREVDPMVRARMRRMQREMANRKTIEATKKATVIVANPTHYAVALRYEVGMAAPVVVAKGIDFLALRMREIAAAAGVPIVENKALARTLYKVTGVDEEIPSSLYKAVSEVIRYVFKIKGIKVGPS